jgi:benzodiazapine receptor
LQLAFNLGWTATFFAAQRPGWAIAEIIVLFALVIATMVAFRPIDRRAFLLMVPYAAWVLYATSLTIGIAVLNA